MTDKNKPLQRKPTIVNTANNMNDSSNPLLRKSTMTKGIPETNSSNQVPDEDREKLYQRIVELLIAAGYFRARIQNLEPFDKILGGIVWTLTGSFYDVDIEFKDDMTLAEKIKTSEKIILALKQVSCPITINPHQIQGLDYPLIYQILQWLVKKLLETRDERNMQNKLLTNKYFATNISSKYSKNSSTKSQQDAHNKNMKKEIFCETKANFISTGRQFRPTTTSIVNYQDPVRVYFTLVEYGMNKDPSFQRTMIDLLKKKNFIEEADSKDNRILKPSIKDNVNPEKGKPQTQSAPVVSNEEQKQLEDLLSSNIKEISNPGFQRINTNIIEEIFSENLDSIVQEIEKFENNQGNENVDRIKLFIKEKDRLDNTKLNIEQQLESAENEIAHTDMKNQKLKRDLTKMNSEIQTLDKTIEENQKNIQKLEEKLKSSKITQEKMNLISDQIKKRDNFKIEIQKMKKECLEDKKTFESQVENLEKKYNKLSDKENSELFNEIDKNYQAEYEKLLLKKKDLFEQNKIINLLTRKIQVYPSKLELIQYQKRFQELYDQINKVSEKSKIYLSEINCREEIKRLVNQKLDIFVQLKNNYKDCKSKKDKENFKESLLNVIEALTESLSKTSERLKVNMKAIEDGQNKLITLQQYESNYMKLIKEYNKEYLKYNR